MNLNLTREALALLREANNSPFSEFTRRGSGRNILFESNGHTLNDPTSTASVSDWNHGMQQLLENEFIEESAQGIFILTTAGKEYADTHLK